MLTTGENLVLISLTISEIFKIETFSSSKSPQLGIKQVIFERRQPLEALQVIAFFLLLLPRVHSQISKEAFSLQAFSGYQALYNTNLKVVFKPFRAIKPCKGQPQNCLALALLSLSIPQHYHCLALALLSISL